MRGTTRPVKRYPVVAQLEDGRPAIEGMEWTRAELRAAAQGGWHWVGCPVCGEAAGRCPDLRKALAGVPLTPAWADDPITEDHDPAERTAEYYRRS